MFPHLTYALQCHFKCGMVFIMAKYHHNAYLKNRRAKFENLLNDNKHVNVYH